MKSKKKKKKRREKEKKLNSGPLSIIWATLLPLCHMGTHSE